MLLQIIMERKCLIFLFSLLQISIVSSQYDYEECARGWIGERDNCYKFTRTPAKNRDDAFDFCRSYSASLVSVNSKSEHDFIVDWLRTNDPKHNLWYTSGNMKVGTWFWDGDDSAFTNIENLWLPNTDDGTGEDAVYAYFEDASRWGLRRTDGYEKLGYICEISKEKLQNNKALMEDRGLDYGLYITNPEFIPRAPKFTQEPVDAIFDTSAREQNNDVRLRCVADGYPYPKYRWFRESFVEDENDFMIDPLKNRKVTQTDGTLNIHDPGQDDLGNYYCVARNEYGTVISKTAKISFGFISEFSDRRSEESGKSYWGKAIYCDPPNHYPVIKYNWVRDKFPDFIQVAKRLFVSMDGNLYFSSLEKSDEAQYSCNVQSVISDTGKIGPFFSLRVDSSSSSQVLQFPNNFPKAFPEVPFAGEEVRLECLAYGFPLPSYSWSREGSNRQLPPKARLSNYNRVLTLPKISIEDIGKYKCTASNGQATISNSITLDIRANPIFTIPLEDQFLDAGSELTWLCEAFGIPDVKYSWLKNGKELREGNLPAEDIDRYRINENILTIKHIDKRQDEGVYQCKAYNALAASYSSGWLKVLNFRPSFKKYPIPKEMFAVVDGNITIPCNPEGAPKPTFTWRQNGIIFGSGGNKKILENGFVVINPVRPGDEGTYSCRAKNSAGSDQSSGELIVLRKPRMITQPLPRETPRVNDSLELQCEADGAENNLELSYVWLKNGMPLKPEIESNIYKDDNEPGFLDIYPVQFKHSGTYTCMIKTPLITLSKSTEVSVFGPPGAPGGVYAVETSSQAMEIQWSDGALNGSPIIFYTIEGQTNHQPEWHSLAENITGVRQNSKGLNYVTLKDTLSPHSTYRFRVRAVNEYGIGLPSLPSPGYTISGAKPSVYPDNIRGGGGKIGDLTMRWDPLPNSEWNAQSIGYFVYWKERDSNEEFMKVDLRNKGNIGLHVEDVGSENFFKPYLLKVQATNRYGDGPISPEVLIYSAENLPAKEPDQVNLQAYNSTAMNVSWTPVSQTRETIRGTLIGHRIRYWQSRDPDVWKKPELSETLLVRGKQSWGLVVGLLPFEWYTMRVSLYNNAGSGKMSESAIFRTFKKAPQNPPTSVQVKIKSQSSILVTWRYVTPTIDEEPLIGYKVRYWERSQGLNKAKDIIKYLDDGKLEALISDLETNTVYHLRVLAFSQGGDGRMSSPSIIFRLKPKSSGANLKASGTFISLTAILSCFIFRLL